MKSVVTFAECLKKMKGSMIKARREYIRLNRLYSARCASSSATVCDESRAAVFPNMKNVQNVTLGPRSGLLVFKR